MMHWTGKNRIGRGCSTAVRGSASAAAFAIAFIGHVASAAPQASPLRESSVVDMAPMPKERPGIKSNRKSDNAVSKDETTAPLALEGVGVRLCTFPPMTSVYAVLNGLETNMNRIVIRVATQYTAAGDVTHAEVVGSSGHPELDAATREWALGVKFCRTGTPGYGVLPVEFNL